MVLFTTYICAICFESTSHIWQCCRTSQNVSVCWTAPICLRRPEI